MRDHIVLAALAFQHRHAQRAQVPPSRLQRALVMTIAGELVRITRVAKASLDIDPSRMVLFFV